jgi:cellulose synthase (UDP-forming)
MRHRVAYFASLWYFFFPLARVVFWATPAWFLLFHLHPLFADVAELLAHLLPSMVLLPLMSAAILPGWPRAFWGVVYECAVSFPLFRAMADLWLPKNLGFKVTPKGIVTERRAFDLGSTKLTLAATALTGVAVAKGLFEAEYFGIEKDAYFFNLGWGLFNLVVLAAALLVAWERPQRRIEERVRRALSVRVAGGGASVEAVTREVGLGGLSFEVEGAVGLGRSVEVEIGTSPTHGSTPGPSTSSGPSAQRDRGGAAGPISLRGRLIYCEPVRAGGLLRRRRRWRCGVAFAGVSADDRRALVRLVFGQAEAWAGAHDARPRTAVGMGLAFARGLATCFAPLRAMRRCSARRRTLRLLTLVWDGRACLAVARDEAERGLGLLVIGAAPPVDSLIPVLAPGGAARWARVAHVRRLAPFLFRGGLELLGPAGRPEGARPLRAWIAA